MTNLSSHDRALVLAEVQKQPYASGLANGELDQALASVVEIFSEFEQKFAPGFCNVLLRSGRLQRPTSFAQELIPGFLSAHRFFGNSLPEGLKRKLRNQTHDTLLELMVLGAFQPHHKAQYEPTLADGKVPDLMLSLFAGPTVYIECKSQRLISSEHDRLFHKATDRIHRSLDLQTSAFVKEAWAEGLRSEVRLSRTPSDADLREFEQTLNEHTPREGHAVIEFGRSITLSVVPRAQAFDEKQPPPSVVTQLGTTPIILRHQNAHAAVYPWAGLDIIRRRSQRRLLGSARRKLRSIPVTAYGLICIQTVSSRSFVPDIRRLLPQKEFERIPIVWLSPITVSRVICRNDAVSLRDQIFGPLG